MVHAIVVTKTTSKMHSKLTFSVWKWPFWCCQQLKALLYCLWREGKKIGSKKGVFVWVPDVCSAKKRPKKNCNKRQSNVPSDLRKGPELSTNAPECFPGARGSHTCKEEKNGTIWQWVVGAMNKIFTKNPRQTTIKHTFGIAGRLGSFIHCSCSWQQQRKERKEKKRKKQNTHECCNTVLNWWVSTHRRCALLMVKFLVKNITGHECRLRYLVPGSMGSWAYYSTRYL